MLLALLQAGPARGQMLIGLFIGALVLLLGVGVLVIGSIEDWRDEKRYQHELESLTQKLIRQAERWSSPGLGSESPP
jgi:hypothetical protein